MKGKVMMSKRTVYLSVLALAVTAGVAGAACANESASESTPETEEATPATTVERILPATGKATALTEPRAEGAAQEAARAMCGCGLALAEAASARLKSVALQNPTAPDVDPRVVFTVALGEAQLETLLPPERLTGVMRDASGAEHRTQNYQYRTRDRWETWSPGELTGELTVGAVHVTDFREVLTPCGRVELAATASQTTRADMKGLAERLGRRLNLLADIGRHGRVGRATERMTAQAVSIFEDTQKDLVGLARLQAALAEANAEPTAPPLGPPSRSDAAWKTWRARLRAPTKTWARLVRSPDTAQAPDARFAETLRVYDQALARVVGSPDDAQRTALVANAMRQLVAEDLAKGP